MELLEDRVLLTTITTTVSNTADSGTGSLRQALLNAEFVRENGSGASCTILFKFSDPGVQTIVPVTPLPEILGHVIMQGPVDAAGNPLVQIRGTSSTVVGLSFNRDMPGDNQPSIVSNLAFQGFEQTAIVINGDGLTQIYGCRIGTDLAGKTAMGNGDGIRIFSSDNIIGLDKAGARYRNVISGNTGDGILIGTEGSTGNIVENSYIGTNLAGNKAIANEADGILLHGGSSGTRIGGNRANQGNVISGNATIGVRIGDTNVGGSDNNMLQGNKIGTNAAGNAAIPNGSGVDIDDTSSHNSIGALTVGSRNVISGNAGTGIITLATASGNKIYGNYIGTNAAGTAAVPNTFGVALLSPNNIVGRAGRLGANVISGNSENGVTVFNDVGAAGGERQSHCGKFNRFGSDWNQANCQQNWRRSDRNRGSGTGARQRDRL